MGRVTPFLIFVLCTVSAFAERYIDRIGAGTNVDCDRSAETLAKNLKHPDAIARAPDRVDSHMLDRAGRLYGYGDKIPPPSDGAHSFLVGRTADGMVHVAVSPRIPDETVSSDGKFVASHRALEKLFPPAHKFWARVNI